MKLINYLKIPEIRNCPHPDGPSATMLHADIIRRKQFLKRIYIEFYNELKRSLGDRANEEYVVEIGSGGGFIKEIFPNVVTSDILRLPGIDMNFSALSMPFEDGSVDIFFMLDVLHHIGDIGAFFKECRRCLRNMGRLIMIEPANTLWGRFIYKNFHHERFDASGGWHAENESTLTGENIAIPWIVFVRDRKIFESEFRDLKIERIEYHTPFMYLCSGGVSMRQLVPDCAYGAIRALERILAPLNKYIGMFMTVEIHKGE